ncbi:MAG TPA: hypothetical protein DCF62_01220 [Porticoccaceae bacterium]|nr:hypothetical protein [Porticoccaceae bacterium]HCO60571.1 hypothetical protein [Porticoccaceae bacterium]
MAQLSIGLIQALFVACTGLLPAASQIQTFQPRTRSHKQNIAIPGAPNFKGLSIMKTILASELMHLLMPNLGSGHKNPEGVAACCYRRYKQKDT